MKSLASLCALLLVPALVPAFEFPKVLIEDYEVPFFDADSAFQSMNTVYAYRTDPLFDTDMIDYMIGIGWTQDVVAGTLTMSENLVTSFEVDGSGHLLVAENRTVPDGSSDDNRMITTWNAGGKPTLDRSIYLEDESHIDSTTYTWTHTNCPDLLMTYWDATTEKVVWTADAQGRCLVGYDSTWDDFTGEFAPSRTFSRTWSANGPFQEVSLDPDTGDTLEIHRFHYMAAGKPDADSIWTLGQDGMSLERACANTFVAGEFHDRRCTASSDAFEMLYTMNLTGTTGVTYRAARKSLPVEAKALPGRILFRNTGSTPVEIDVRGVDGARFGVVSLQAGAAGSVPATSRTIVWKATSGTATRSGLVNTIR